MPRGSRGTVIFVSRVGSTGVTVGEGIKRLHPDKRMCLPKGGQKGEAAPKTNRRGSLTGMVLSLWVAWLAKAPVGPGQDKQTEAERLESDSQASRGEGNPVPQNGPHLVWCSQPRKNEGDAHGEEREKEEVRW